MIAIQELTAYATALIIRATIYGLYAASSVHCFRWLLFDDQGGKLRKRVDWRLTSVAVFIFCFLTTTLGVTSRTTLDLIQSNLHSAVLSIAKISTENFGVLITNAVLIYRCWKVFDRSHQWLVIFPPIILWCSAFVCQNLLLYYYIMAHRAAPNQPLIFARLVPQARPLWASFYCCDIAINVFTTAAIILRIRRLAVNSNFYSTPVYTTCKILAQFGFLYAITTTLALIGLLVDVKASIDVMRFILDSIMITMPGITFNLIQIRIHQERASAIDPILSRARTFPQSPVHVYTERISVRDDSVFSKSTEV